MHSAFDTGQRLLRQAKQFAWFAVLAGIIILLPGVPGMSESMVHWGDGSDVRLPALGVVLLSGYAGYRRIATYIRAEPHRTAVAADAARREGVSLAATTVQHEVSTRLAVAVGYSELLAEDPRLPAELEAQARKIVRSAQAAADAVDHVATQVGRVQVNERIAGPPLLDLEGATLSPNAG